MSFVFPALLGTLLAAGIPVVLHLMLRPKPKTLPFPAFRFLVAKHRANTRSLRLRHLLLLLLRMVLIAGLILAIARPRLFQQNLGLSSERPVFAVFVFDTSPSMEYRSADQRTRLDDAKKRAHQLLAELPIGSRIEIRTTTDRPGDRIDATANLTEVGKRIDALEIAPAGPATNRAIAASLKELADVATKQGDDAGRKMPRLLCIFSDTTRGAWDPEEAALVETASDLVPPSREALIAARPEIAGVLAMMKQSPEKLASVAEMGKHLEALGTEIPRLGPGDFPLRGEPAELVRQARRSLRASLKESAGRAAGLVPAGQVQSAVASSPTGTSPAARQESDEIARWEASLRKTLRLLSGQETLWFDVGMNPLTDLAIVRIEWPQRDGQPVEAFAPHEEVKLGVVVEAAGQKFEATLTCEHEAGKLTQAILVKAGETKMVPFDLNLAALKLGPGYHSVTLSLDARDGWAGDNRRFATFQVREQKRILVVSDRPERPGELQGALRANRYTVETKTPAEVENGIPGDADAVFLFGLAEPSGDLWRSLEKYVSGGGGLAVVPGDEKMKPAAYSYKSQNAAGMASLLPGEFKKVIEIPQNKTLDAGETWSFEPETNYRHPILKPFERWRHDPGINLAGYPPRARKFWEVANQGTLLRYTDGHPALLEKTLKDGKIVQLTTTLDARQDRWNNYLDLQNGMYVVLVGLTAQYLTGDADGPQCNYTSPGPEPTVWARGWGGKRVQPIGPGPGKLDAITVPADTARLAIPQATTPGNYRVLDTDGKAQLAAFSVNLTTAEVTPVRLAPATIENVFGDGVIVPADRGADLRRLLEGHWHEPVELFPYFMIGILLLLALENLLANRFYRRQPGEAAP